MTHPWPPSLQDEIGNALLTAQNVLVGYAQLANSSETEEHYQSAQHALEVVREAIRKGGILEAQGIVEPTSTPDSEPSIRIGDTVKMTDAAYRAQTPTTAFRNGQVVDLYGDVAEVDWIDPFVAREVKLTDLEKVERKKRPEAWTEAAGFAVGDRVRFTDDFRRSTGRLMGEEQRGTVQEIRDAGKPHARAVVDWDDGEGTATALLKNLVKVRGREPGR